MYKRQECAIALENAAARAIEKNAAPPELYFPIREEEEILLADRKEIIRKIFRETRAAKTWYKEEERAEALALSFHEAVSCMVLEMCRRIRERFHEDKVASVSYTHLDVYKRQPNGWEHWWRYTIIRSS